MADRRKPSKLTVLLDDELADRLDRYCHDRGFKKSTLAARLIRQYLEMEGYGGDRARGNPFAGPRTR
jgi:predicted transcriptional regulator